MTGPHVQVADLRAALSVLLDQLEQTHGSEINLDADYYWDIDPDIAFDPARDPSHGLWTSQLTDDLESLQKLATQAGDEPPIVWHDLAHVVGILRRLAHLDQPAAPPVRPDR